MAKEWWDEAPVVEDSGDWWESAPLVDDKPKKRTWGEAAEDTGRGIMSGAAGLVKSGGDLYGLATGDMDNTASELGRNAQDYWQSGDSQSLKDKKAARKAAIDAQDGIGGKAWEALKGTVTDPALAADAVATNIATLIPGMAVGRLASGAKFAAGVNAASKVGPANIPAIASAAGSFGTKAAIGTGAVQQGADVAGDVYESAMKKPDSVWAQNPEFVQMVEASDGSKEAIQSIKKELALKAARITLPAASAISVAANAIPGASMLERTLVGGAARETIEQGAKLAIPKAMAKGAFGEMAQEGIEEGGGAFSGNVAKRGYIDPSQDLREGVGENAGMGMAGGFLLGGAGGMGHRAAPKPADVLKAESLDEAIAVAAASVESAANNTAQSVGRAWQELGVSKTGETSNIAARQAGQTWQGIAPEQAGSLDAQRAAIEHEGAQASQARDASLAAIGQQWRALGITNPQDDLQAQRAGMRGEPTAMQLAMQRAQENANGVPTGVLPTDTGRNGQDGNLTAESLGTGTTIAGPSGVQPGRLDGNSVGESGEYAGGVPASAVTILQAELERTEPFTREHSDLIDQLQTAVSSDAQAAIDSGSMPVYATGNGNHVAIHPSAQNPGKIQVSRYAKDGIIGDSQYNSIEEAVRSEGLWQQPRLEAKAAEAVIGASAQAESQFQDRNVQNVPTAAGKETQTTPSETRTDAVSKPAAVADLPTAGAGAAVQADGVTPSQQSTRSASTAGIEPQPKPVDQRLTPVPKRTESTNEKTPEAVKATAQQQEAPAAAGVAKLGLERMPTASAPQGVEVSRFTGKYKKGMNREPAKMEAMRLNARNTDKNVTYAAEEHNDPKLDNPYAVVGRKAVEQKPTPALVNTAQPAIESVAEAGPVGRNNVPLSEGGKPYKTKLGADTARKNQPMMRVRRVAGGYALIEKTPAQIAAQEKAAKRLSQPRTSPKGEPIPAHAMIAAAGGLHPNTRSDMGMQGNVTVGNRKLFAGEGRGLTIEQATEKLIEEGYLQEGAGHDNARDLIKRSLSNPQYTPEGTERMAAREMEAREKAFNEEQEAVAEVESLDDNEFEAIDDADIPWDAPVGNVSEADAMRSMGFDEQEIQDAIASQSARQGGDRQGSASLDEGAAKDAQESVGEREGTPGQDQGSGEGLTLTAPTRREVIAQQDALDAEAKRKEEGGDRPIQKKVTGDTPDMFNTQGSVFDVPAEPEPTPTDPIAQSVQAKPGPDTGSDIPPRYFKKVKVDHEVWIEDERKSETHKVSAKDALSSIKDDLENYKKLLNCMKG